MRDYLTAMDEAMFANVGPREDSGRVLAALGPEMLELAARRATGAVLTSPRGSPPSGPASYGFRCAVGVTR
jgi:hypothetical protein